MIAALQLALLTPQMVVYNIVCFVMLRYDGAFHLQQTSESATHVDVIPDGSRVVQPNN